MHRQPSPCGADCCWRCTLSDATWSREHALNLVGNDLIESGRYIRRVMGLALTAASRMLLIEQFQPLDVLNRMAAHGATMFMGVPAMYGVLASVDNAPRVPSLRVCVSGGAPLPPARDAAEAERRQLFFDLIEDHLDTVYDTVRRELTYLECSGSVPEGYLSVRDLVDATILKGLERFEQRPTEFSIGDWLLKLAFETIEAEDA